MVHRASDNTQDNPEGRAGAPDRHNPTSQPAGAGQSPSASTEALQAQLSEEKARADGYLAQWQRATADFQNFKRRTEQEREELESLVELSEEMSLVRAGALQVLGRTPP